MFQFCRSSCEYVELHAPSSFGLDELLVRSTRHLVGNMASNCLMSSYNWSKCC